MRIVVASDAGICFGVKRATTAAFEAAAAAPGLMGCPPRQPERRGQKPRSFSTLADGAGP